MNFKGRVLEFSALICAACIIVTACGNNNGASNSVIGKENKELSEIPQIDQYDTGMSQAHFISAPALSYLGEASDENMEGADNAASSIDKSIASTDDYDSNARNTKITEYEVSYNLSIPGTDASFVLGDARGEYGELILCEIAERGEEASFTVKRFAEGIYDNTFGDASVTFQGNEAHDYSVNIKISGKELSAQVNGEDLGSFEIPEIALGCVGVYKIRATSFAYIDDICVRKGKEVLFEDDFDGSFKNGFYEYQYANEAVSAFSPYYIITEEKNGSKSLRLSSGFVLSETEADTAPDFRREFACDKKKLNKAYLYMTALGSFDVAINGKAVQDSFFDPGKMVFDTYIDYVSYDVTDLIEKENTMDISLFHGFFNRGNGYPESTCRWGDGFGVKGELVLVYKDGTTEIIPTDEKFKVNRNTRYRFNDVYHGEIIDDRYAASEAVWEDVLVDDVDPMFINAKLGEKSIEPIRAIETLEPISVTEPVPGHFVYDFGKNIAGTISFNLKNLKEELKEGQVVTFRYGEILNSEQMVNSDAEVGTVWRLNLMTARATDYYVCADEGKDIEKTFSHTYHGFRYVEITGVPSQIPTEDIRALALSTDMHETGSFTCSSDIINQFYSNSKNSMRNNLMDNPTDCPQRDERLGWSGDAQITSLFAMYQFDSKAFYENYLTQMRLQQDEDSAFMDVAPYNSKFGGHNCWGDAPVAIMWNHYLQYGDRTVLEDNYDALCKWVDYLVNTSDDYLRRSEGYGDHISRQSVDEALTDTAWCARSAQLVSRMADILGKEADAAKYRDHAEAFKKKWQETYLREDWSVGAGIINTENETETAYSIGIMFDLFPEDMMGAAKERLKILAEFGGYEFYPGYSGLAYFLPALSSGGYSDTAIKVLENMQPGGIAHPLAMGLTTNPEEAYAFVYSDESGNPYEGGKYRVDGSLDHAAYSAVCSFLFSDILGIKADENAPGYEHFCIVPAYSCGLEFANGSYDSRFGTISVSWNITDKTVQGEVPAGTACTLTLPDGSKEELSEGAFSMTW